jgi:hypothetical protein
LAHFVAGCGLSYGLTQASWITRSRDRYHIFCSLPYTTLGWASSFAGLRIPKKLKRLNGGSVNRIKFPLSAFFSACFLLVLSSCGEMPGNALSNTPANARHPSVSISIQPSSVLPGQNATLTWSSTGASSCVGSGSWSGTHPASGSVNVMLLGTTAQTYTLECKGAGGAGTQSATLGLSQTNGECSTSPPRPKHGMQSRAVTSARRRVAAGTAGSKRASQP